MRPATVWCRRLSVPRQPNWPRLINLKGQRPLTKQRPDITTEMVDRFLVQMYGGSRADFVHSVSRDVVQSCQVPVLVMPDDSPPHARQDIHYVIQVFDSKTRQPIENGSGQLFAG